MLIMEVIECVLVQYGYCVVLVLLLGIQYCIGQVFDFKVIIVLVYVCGCMVGFDLVYVVGNLLLVFNDSGMDFVVWCYYKYVNFGFGVVGGVFVYECYVIVDLLCFYGWWGNCCDNCFQMVLSFDFILGVEGWQLFNLLILVMVLLCILLEIFCCVGMDWLCVKLLQFIGYLEWLVNM